MFEEQFEKAGGLEYFLGQAIREFMKYGFVLMSPNLSFKSKRITKTYELIPTIESIVFLDPQWVYAFYGDEQDGNKVNAVRYINQPKTIYKDGEVIDLPASSTIIDFDKSLSALCTLDGYGNPMGTSFLKDVWDLWRVLNNMNNSFNSNLVQFGEHSWNFVPNQAFFTDSNATSEVTKNINEFISNGGGVFMCRYGTLEKMDSMDLSKYDDYHTNISQELARRKGLSIDVLGESHGASRNLAQFAQSTAVTRASEIASQFAFQFSERFIKNYFENVFAKYYFTKQLTDTLSLVFELPEGTPDTVGQVEEVKTEEELDILVNDNAVIEQEGSKTWIKSPLTSQEAFVVDSKALDNALNSANDKLEAFYVTQMKRYLTKSDRIEKAIDNPTSISNSKTLTSAEQKAFDTALGLLLYEIIKDFAINEVLIYEKALKLQGKELSKSVNELAEIETQKILKSASIKSFKRNSLSSFMNELDNTLSNNLSFVSTIIADNRLQGTAELMNNLNNIQGRDFKKLAPLGTISLLHIANDYFINKNNEGLTLIRSGFLEGQCEHCAEYMGATYEWVAGEWVGDMDYKTLPDSECAGGDRCRCYYTRIPLGIVNELIEVVVNG